jgi:hypothetical protein
MATTCTEALATVNWSACKKTRTSWACRTERTAGVETRSPQRNGRSTTAHVTQSAEETRRLSVRDAQSSSSLFLLTQHRWWTRFTVGGTHRQHTKPDRLLRPASQLLCETIKRRSNLSSSCQNPLEQRILCAPGREQAQYSGHRSWCCRGHCRSRRHYRRCLVLHAPQASEASRRGLSPQCCQRRPVCFWRQAPHKRLINERLAHRPELHGQEAEQWQHCRQRGLLETDIEGRMISLRFAMLASTNMHFRSPTSERLDESIWQHSHLAAIAHIECCTLTIRPTSDLYTTSVRQ